MNIDKFIPKHALKFKITSYFCTNLMQCTYCHINLHINVLVKRKLLDENCLLHNSVLLIF